ncbi:hypothetical protein B9Z19DRAFT_1099326 [Tuber borchii]|uniref:C2H2 type master regulator of conidiophore development brlA n=1 Tax=Tuber borchii TaxID=42251 RepID=A0A2T7A3F2_TUBBO|nr:hypothetical protein B9Z19DRAFT_1099326 [Tuber borchii]
MPMDRSPDCMDLDVGDDRRETAWWEDLTKNSVRMQELVGNLNPACFPIDETRPCSEVEIALERMYYDLHPSHARGAHLLTFRTACAHIIPIINISRQNAGGSAGGMGAFTSTMSSFLREGYPESAPFNGEALHSRAGDDAGDESSIPSSHGGAGSLRSGVPLSLHERPRTGDRSHPCDSQPHTHPPYGNPATPTPSDSTKCSPGRSNSGSPHPSGGTDSYLSADENIRSYPFSPALTSPRRSRANSHSRSVLNQGQPPIHTGHHFDVPPPRSSNGTGPGGQHKCDACGKAFPYLSKLKDHKHIHRPDKPLPCNYPDCLKSFKRPRELQAHRKTHSRKSQFVGIPAQPGIPRDPQRVPHPHPHPPAPYALAPPRQPPSSTGYDGGSPTSELLDSDRTSSASPRESTFSRSSTPASSHTDGGVAILEPLVADTLAVDRQREVDRTDTEQTGISDRLHERLNRQLFPGLA